MEMAKQVVDQLIASAISQAGSLPQAAKSQKAESGREGKDFDSMVREKYQGSDRSKETGETGKKAQEAAPKAEEDKPAVEEQTSEVQQLLAAAMLVQPVAAAEEPVQIQEAAAVQAGPELQADAVQDQVQTPAQQLPGQAGDLSQPQQEQPQTAVPQMGSQAAEQPRQEAVQAPEQQAAPTGTVQIRDVQTQQDRPVHRAEGEAVRQDGADEAGQTEDAPAQVPLFGRVDATPVKVAEPQAEPVEVYAPEAPEQLSQQILAASQAGLDRVEITLTPENLGKVTVEIARSDSGALSVVLTAADPKAVQALEKHTADLQQLLASNSQNSDVRVEVRGNEEAQQQFLSPDDGRRQDQREPQRQREQRKQTGAQDFVHRLRLGLTGLDGEQ